MPSIESHVMDSLLISFTFREPAHPIFISLLPEVFHVKHFYRIRQINLELLGDVSRETLRT
jgi:hypothetical protein